MSDTPPLIDSRPLPRSRDHTPELTSKREKRHGEGEEDDRDRHGRYHRPRRDDSEYEREREPRHRHHDEETEEEREERHRRRREREIRDRERDNDGRREPRDRDRDRDLDRGSERYRDRERDHERERESRRDRSRESHKSRESHRSSVREMTREEKERERERRDREMMEERRATARLETRYSRERSPPRRRRSPPPPPEEKDPVNQLLDEVDSESRSIFVSQLAARLTSSDLGLFFEDKLGRGSVRDARVIMDKGSRRSKGIGYVELDAVELVNRAIALSGTIVMGIPISIQLTEAERNREGQDLNALLASAAAAAPPRRANTYTQRFPQLSIGLALPPGLDPDAHSGAAIPYHRLFITNLSSSLSKDDLLQVFEPFGVLEFVDLHVDFSGHSKGTAYVQFRDLSAAQMALDAMDGFELAGRTIKVQTIQERSYIAEQIEDSGMRTRLDATQRQQLMYKLARTEMPGSNPSSRPSTTVPKPSTMRPTHFLIVSNMFNPEEETERNWDLDLAEDVKGEVETKYGKVARVKVEKLSQGEVYIEFVDVDGAERALRGLGGRFFGGRQLQASYISEALFKAHL